jgi:hypothetical protein
MRRWQFAAAVGAGLGLPLAALAQESAPKVVAYLGTQSPEPLAERVRAFVQGLCRDRPDRGSRRDDRISLGERQQR